MVSNNQIAEIGFLVGEPVRAAMLATLMNDAALTAGELAGVAGITAQTASSHLAKLVAANFLSVERRGRRRYHRLASAQVARLLEGMMQLAAESEPRCEVRMAAGRRSQAMRIARTCYDHLAGRLGVDIAANLIDRGALEFHGDAGLLTPVGAKLLHGLGIPVPGADSLRSAIPICRPCLDWSERRPHLGGALGRAICSHCVENGWIRRVEGSRAMTITVRGLSALRQAFGIGPLT